MAIISPSLLASDFSNLREEVAKVEKAGAEYLHLDVMDGNFVPNISFGPGIIAAIRAYSHAVFDVHLMIEKPERYIRQFKEAGADIITFHYEAADEPEKLLQDIRTLGCQAGISVKPATDPQVLFPLLPLLDHVLIMTVEPGFGGQKLMPSTIESVKVIKSEIIRLGLDKKVHIAVDGGINPDNINLTACAGADVFVAGSAVFKAADPKSAIELLRSRAAL